MNELGRVSTFLRSIVSDNWVPEKMRTRRERFWFCLALVGAVSFLYVLFAVGPLVLMALLGHV